MRHVILVTTLTILLAACEPEQQSTETVDTDAPGQDVATIAPEPETPVEVSLADALAMRPAADVERDPGRKPLAVVEFIGIEPGMTVLDLLAASGWYSEVLANAVGPTGKVYAHNNEILLTMREGVNDTAMTERLAGGRLPNVERLDREMDDLGLAPGSVDAAMFALNFHDVYNRGGPDATLGLLTMIHGVLKPGGVLAVIDHEGAEGNDNAELHRIEKAKALEVIAASPFSVDGESDLLANSDDDLSTNVFDPQVRGKTHRFLLRLKK